MQVASASRTSAPRGVLLKAGSVCGRGDTVLPLGTLLGQELRPGGPLGCCIPPAPSTLSLSRIV